MTYGNNLFSAYYNAQLTAKAYVQDGLIAMWDGIENAGWGVHDGNATVWKNLVNNSPFGDGERIGSDLSTKLPVWTASSCYSPEVYSAATTKKACFNVTASFDATQSVICGETVVCTRNAATGQQGVNASACMACDVRLALNYNDSFHVMPAAVFFYSESQYQFWGCGGNSASAILNLDPNVMRSYHVERESSGTTLACRVNNGTEYKGMTKSNGFTASKSTEWALVVANQSVVEVFCIRYYSRALTAEEIVHNYAIDKARFNIQ